jgi:hypothetical protein
MEIVALKGPALLCIAAWVQDIGYICQAADHVVTGTAIALDIMSGYGFSADQL